MDASFVYFVSRRDGSIHKVHKTGGPDVLLVPSRATPPRAIAVDDKRVYFIDTGTKGNVMWVAK
jgi:hypothetical protein